MNINLFVSNDLKGALVGLVVSSLINLWIGVGSSVIGIPVEQKPYSVSGCSLEDLAEKKYIFLIKIKLHIILLF